MLKTIIFHLINGTSTRACSCTMNVHTLLHTNYGQIGIQAIDYVVSDVS